jgi:uncharacterized protein (DUF58 family)
MPGAPTAITFGAVLMLAGAGFGSPSLLVAGLGLAGLAAAAAAWVELARPARLVRAPGPSRVVEGEPYSVRLRAEGGTLPPPAGELSDPILPAPVPVGPLWRGAHAAEVVLEGRGRRHLGRARLEIRDPLGLRTRVVESAEGGELLVLPRVEAVMVAGRGFGGGRGSAIAGLDEGAAASRLDARAIELEVDGLRPYREGSPASRIHWPAVARTGELIERRLVAGGDTAPLVVLDAARPADQQSLDAAVRAAASLCVHLARNGGCAALLPGDRRPTDVEPDLRAWSHLHARLALVESGVPSAVGRTLRPGAVFWVTAASAPALPQALRGGGSGARYLVAPAPLLGAQAGRAAAFTVAGCVGTLRAARPRRTLGRVA